VKKDDLRKEDAHQHHCPTCGRDWDCWCWRGDDESVRNQQCLECLIEESKPKVYRHDGCRVSKLFGATYISEGGWIGRRWMTTKELRAAINRWVRHSYDTGKLQPNYDGWIEYQCGGCRFLGAFDGNYGVCCNPDGPNDGRIVSEHGGCVEHSALEVTG